MLTDVQVMFYGILASVIRRARRLVAAPERGAGGNTLETLLLVIGGVIAAGLVVAFVASRINSEKSKIAP